MRHLHTAFFIFSCALLVAANAAAYWYSKLVGDRWSDLSVPFKKTTTVAALVLTFMAVTMLAAAVLYFNRKTIAKGGKAFYVTLAITTTLLFAAPVASPLLGSADVYWHTLMARGWVIHGMNPYETRPYDLAPEEPWLYDKTAPAWRGYTMVYGPLWTMLSTLAILPTKDVEAELYAMKALCGVGYISAGSLLFFWLKKRGNAHANLALAAWMLSPFAAFEIAGGAHQEGWLALALVVFLIGLREKRPDIALPALWAAIFIKIWPFVLVPALAGLRKTDRRQWLIGAAICAGMTAASLLIFGIPDKLYPSLAALNGVGLPAKFSPGLHLLWQFFGAQGWDAQLTLQLAKGALNGAFGIFAAVMGWMAWKRKIDPVTAAGAIILAFFGAVVGWLHPWYFVAGIPSLLFHERDRYGRRIAALTLLCLVSFASYAFGWALLTLLFLFFTLIAGVTFAPFACSALRDKKRSDLSVTPF